jgi:hypothetical protein
MNVHPGESLGELVDVLRGPAARVRSAWRGSGDMGAGLWLPLESARAIATDDGAADQVREALAESGLFAFTVNAFPAGGFHAARVKEQVYRPTWTDVARLDYTRHACRALARLLPEGARGSVSTVPVAYGAFDSAETDPVAAATHLGRLTLDLLKLETETGHEVSLALEPEPLASLSTTADAIAFLRTHVFTGAARTELTAAGLSPLNAEAALRRFIGVCVDTCHLACEFETISESLKTLADAGVRVVKGQLSSALQLDDPLNNVLGRVRLMTFSEPRYLHQSIARSASGERIAAGDLPDVFTSTGALDERFADAQSLRVHFHVPLSWEGDAHLGSTRHVLEEGLAALCKATDHLEVETYTFDVFPEAQRQQFGGDVVEMIVAELRWVEKAL